MLNRIVKKLTCFGCTAIFPARSGDALKVETVSNKYIAKAKQIDKEAYLNLSASAHIISRGGIALFISCKHASISKTFNYPADFN